MNAQAINQNQNNTPMINFEESFPKPPYYFKQENLVPPNIEEISHTINPEFYCFGRNYKFHAEKEENKNIKNLDKTPIKDFKMELKKINNSILFKIIELFENSSDSTENLAEIMNDIMKLIKKFFKITTFIKHNVQAKENMLEVLKEEIKIIDENKEKLVSEFMKIQKKFQE